MKQEIAREMSRGKVQMQVSDLPFSEIPHQSRLFLDYLSDAVSLRRFYPNAVASPANISSYGSKVIRNYQTDRTALCDALTEINVNAGAGQKVLENITRLRDPACVAVLTGQQAGLFTGPLYTIYKALSAIKMAEQLSGSGVPAVPVFWAATEDHDFEEVSASYVNSKTGELAESKYSSSEHFKGRPVGDITIEDSIAVVIDALFGNMPETEFSTELRTVLERSWSPGNGFGDAFIKTLAALIADFGLIFIDPMHPGIKALSSPIYVNAIKNSDEIVKHIGERSRELENEGYHAQVLVDEDYFPFFWIDDNGRRVALRKVRIDGYRAKDGEREFSSAELCEIAAKHPERLSPGVMLRPVVQDYLLPTVCYFGGAAEIAYFAQNAEAYRVLNRPVTPILHRQSFTIVEAKQRKVLEKFELRFPQLFDGIEKTVLSVAEKNAAAVTAPLFAEVEEKINTELNRLDRHVSQIDPTVADNLAKRRRKMIYHIAALRKKTILAQLRNDEVASRQIENLFSALLPNGELQERTLNVFTFLNKFGPNFIEWLYQAIDLEDRDHRIVDL